MIAAFLIFCTLIWLLNTIGSLIENNAGSLLVYFILTIWGIVAICIHFNTKL